MSGKVSVRGSYQVQGCRGGRGKVRDSRRYSYSGATTKHKVLCSALGTNVFEYFQKA